MSYVKRNLEELTITKVENAHGGVGPLYVAQLLGVQDGAIFPGDRMDFQSKVHFVHRLKLPKGTSIGVHRHTNTEEFYYVEQGHAVMIADGKEIDMPPHSIFLIKSGSEHAFLNRETEDVIAIVMEIGL